MKNPMPWSSASVTSSPCMLRDADGEALVVGDRQDHRHEDRRREAEDVQRPRADRRQLRQQEHRDQQRRDRDPAHVVPHDPRLVMVDVRATSPS